MSTRIPKAEDGMIEPQDSKGPGRPRKPNALSAAERAKRYREKVKVTSTVQAASRNDELCNEVIRLKNLLVQLQMKYDLEHQKVIRLETDVAGLQLRLSRPAVNPMTAKVAELKKTIAEQDKARRHLIEAFNKRDGLKSRK
jgi:hypothetical protein